MSTGQRRPEGCTDPPDARHRETPPANPPDPPDADQPGPPRLARRLLRALLPTGEREEVAAAVDGYFRRLARSRGRAAARRWYWKEAVTAGPRLRIRQGREGTMGAKETLRTMVRELGLAVRSLARAPGYALATLVTLALGMGATTTVFGVVDSVLLEPLPYDEAEELVSVLHAAPGIGMSAIPHATGLHVLYAERSRSFESLALYGAAGGTLLGEGGPERVEGAVATPALFQVLRTEAALGRTFTEEEGRPGGPAVILLSHALWTERFGADPEMVGRTLVLDGETRQVVGVMPRGFDFPRPGTRFWLPLEIDPLETRVFGGFNYPGIGRLAEGATAASAVQELRPLLDQGVARFGNLTREFVDHGRITPLVRPYMDDVVGDVRTPLWIVLATVGFVLLIACINVANLGLVRGESRRQETAVRRALGARQGHILGHSLAESLVLAAGGALLGLLLTVGGLELVRTLGGDELPRAQRIAVDGSTFLLAALLAAGATVLFGLLPALQARSGRSGGLLPSGSRGGGAGRRSHRIRHVLVALQVAFAFVLLTGSGLMVRTFHALSTVDAGFRSEGVLTFRLSLPEGGYPSPRETARFHTDLLDRIQALPGVEAAGVVTRIPLNGLSDMGPWTARSRLADPSGGQPRVQARAATPGYFEAMGIPVLRGDAGELRSDTPGSPLLVSREAARLLMGDEGAVDGQLSRDVVSSDEEGRWARVAGVVGDARYLSLHEEPTGVVYTPILVHEEDDWQTRTVDYVVRAGVPPTSLVPALRTELRELDPALPLAAVRTMEEVEREDRARTTFTMVLLLVAAAVGLLLGAVGLYGVLAYVTARRTREMGVRLALGAPVGSVRRLVVGQGLGVAAAGMALGLGGAWALGRFLSGLLYQVEPTDPATYGAVAALLLGVSALAVWIPARRASRVDVVEALRSE